MIKQFTFNHFEENTYIVYNEQKDAALVDVGCAAKAEEDALYAYIKSENLNIKYLLLTHAHIDHFCGMSDASKYFNLPITMHKDGTKLFDIFTVQAPNMGFEAVDMSQVKFNYVQYDSEIKLSEDYVFKILDASGHCPGSIAYYDVKDKAVFCGDAIFHMSIGRTDLYGGDLDVLLANIKKNILTLPEDTLLMCGHGQTSDIAYEKNNNPYVIDFR